MSAKLSAGFADPVADAQSCFRAVLEAMARPGQTRAVPIVAAPAPLCDAAAGVLLALTDHETPLWLDPLAANAADWIAFHTGAPLVPAAQAMFAVALTLPDLADLPHGTDEAPEASATVVLQVLSLETGRQYRLEGPGLREPALVSIAGLPANFAALWERNHAAYPRGIDLVLCAGNQLAALPRSVSVREA